MFNFRLFVLATLITGTSLFAENTSSCPAERDVTTAENSTGSDSCDQDKDSRTADREPDHVHADCQAAS